MTSRTQLKILRMFFESPFETTNISPNRISITKLYIGLWLVDFSLPPNGLFNLNNKPKLSMSVSAFDHWKKMNRSKKWEIIKLNFRILSTGNRCTSGLTYIWFFLSGNCDWPMFLCACLNSWKIHLQYHMSLMRHLTSSKWRYSSVIVKDISQVSYFSYKLNQLQ